MPGDTEPGDTEPGDAVPGDTGPDNAVPGNADSAFCIAAAMPELDSRLVCISQTISPTSRTARGRVRLCMVSMPTSLPEDETAGLRQAELNLRQIVDLACRAHLHRCIRLHSLTGAMLTTRALQRGGQQAKHGPAFQVMQAMASLRNASTLASIPQGIAVD